MISGNRLIVMETQAQTACGTQKARTSRKPKTMLAARTHRECASRGRHHVLISKTIFQSEDEQQEGE